MPEFDEAKSRAATTYNAAVDNYADAALVFWDRYGQRTIGRMKIAAGDTILDVCSGAGASALPAGRRVSPGGRVLGIDLAENLLEIARQVQARGFD